MMEFQKVEDVSTLIPILERRIPHSANVYNMAKLHSNWTEEIKWYTLGERGDSAVILGVIFRLDRNQDILVSRHPDVPVTEEIRKAFTQTPAIKWNETYRFLGLDKELCDLVVNIGTEHFGNSTGINPCDYYLMEVEKAKLLDTENHFGEEVKISQIPGEQGADFITNTWKYSIDGTRHHVKKVVDRNPSSGVSVKGEIVSGAVFNSTGYIGMLYTLEEHRGKGYGAAGMRFLMKNCAMQGLIPSCTVEVRNLASQAFQTKLGFIKLPWKRYYVFYTKADF